MHHIKYFLILSSIGAAFTLWWMQSLHVPTGVCPGSILYHKFITTLALWWMQLLHFPAVAYPMSFFFLASKSHLCFSQGSMSHLPTLSVTAQWYIVAHRIVLNVSTPICTRFRYIPLKRLENNKETLF